MDTAYNQHSPHSRHHSHTRSSTNLNHLSLAPLTTRIPLNDFPDHDHTYIENRSLPTTPSILSRSSSRVSSKRKPVNLSLPKSKSSTHISAQRRSGTTTPGGTKLRKVLDKDQLSGKDRNDSDWLLRAGAAITSSARESKGQAWLVSRASSTSLTAQRDEEEEELEREREAFSRRESRQGSVVGSADADDEFSPVTTRRSLSFATASGSRPMSRMHSRRGSRAQLFTPGSAVEREGYFDHRDCATHEAFITEPDFVDAEEENSDEVQDDEATVRKLARANSLGLGGWVEKMLGWSLFAVDEDGEETETEMLDEKAEDSELSSRPSRIRLDSAGDTPPEGMMPPLRDDEAGGWQDAAWLLSVATKVLL